MRIRTKGYLFVGHMKVPMPVLSTREILEREKAFLRNPKEKSDIWF